MSIGMRIFWDMYFPYVTLVLFAHTVPGMTHDTM